LKAEDLAYWNVEKHAFTVEKGKVKLMVGSSSESPLTPKGGIKKSLILSVE